MYGTTITASITNATPNTTYYIRVSGSNTGANGSGAYDLTLNMGSQAIATLSPLNTTVSVQSDQGGTGIFEFSSSTATIGGLQVNDFEQDLLKLLNGTGTTLVNSWFAAQEAGGNAVGAAALDQVLLAWLGGTPVSSALSSFLTTLTAAWTPSTSSNATVASLFSTSWTPAFSFSVYDECDLVQDPHGPVRHTRFLHPLATDHGLVDRNN